MQNQPREQYSMHFREPKILCKKQTAVSHNSSECDVISLDAGWRMDGVTALDRWNLVIDVLHT